MLTAVRSLPMFADVSVVQKYLMQKCERYTYKYVL